MTLPYSSGETRENGGTHVPRKSGIIARLRVRHQHKCQIGLDSETNLWVGNHAEDGDVWRCGECGALYVWHGPHEEYPRTVTGGWLLATKAERKALDTGEEVPARVR